MPTTLDLTGDLGFYRDDDYVLVLPVTFDDVGADLADFEFTAQLRTKPRRGGDLVAEFTVEIDDDQLILTLDADDTVLLPDVAYWDLQVAAVADGFRETWLAGQVSASGDVTYEEGS